MKIKGTVLAVLQSNTDVKVPGGAKGKSTQMLLLWGNIFNDWAWHKIPIFLNVFPHCIKMSRKELISKLPCFYLVFVYLLSNGK